MAAKEDDETSAWTFPKLTGPANWTDWSRSMKFALLALDLWGNVSGERVLPDENREPEKSDKWDTRDAKARGKIGLMCVTSIQMQLQSDWTAKETWDYLRRFCTPSGWSNKWELMSKVDHLSLAKCKDIADFMSQLTQLRNEVMDQKITIEDYFVIKAINSLGQRYETWVTYLAQQARDSQDGKLPSYKTIFENLQQEEHRQKQRAEQANFTRGGGNRITTPGIRAPVVDEDIKGHAEEVAREAIIAATKDDRYQKELAKTANAAMRTRNACVAVSLAMDGAIAKSLATEIIKKEIQTATPGATTPVIDRIHLFHSSIRKYR